MISMKPIAIIFALLFSGLASAYDVVVTYSWDSNPASNQLTKYECEVQINIGPYASCSVPIIPPANALTETISGVNSGDIITAHVRACNVVGCSAFSERVSGTVPPNLVPAVPVNLQLLPMVITP